MNLYCFTRVCFFTNPTSLISISIYTGSSPHQSGINRFWESGLSLYRGLGEYYHQNHPRYHLVNHRQYYRVNHPQSHGDYHHQNALRPHSKRVPARRNVSQNPNVFVMLHTMRRQKLDPKHVRWFFYHHALSVRLMTLLFDGIWWCITKGFFGLYVWAETFSDFICQSGSGSMNLNVSFTRLLWGVRALENPYCFIISFGTIWSGTRNLP